MYIIIVADIVQVLPPLWPTNQGLHERCASCPLYCSIIPHNNP